MLEFKLAMNKFSHRSQKAIPTSFGTGFSKYWEDEGPLSRPKDPNGIFTVSDAEDECWMKYLIDTICK